MTYKPVIKVSFNENAQDESAYFMKRLLEKVILEQLELTPAMQGAFLRASEGAAEEVIRRRE